MSIAKRSIQSSAYNISSTGIQTVINFVRSIWLARLLLPEDFGTYTYAASVIALTITIPAFGLSSALLHRAKETEGDIALRVHFTLSVVFALIWAVILHFVSLVILPESSF